MQAVREYLVEEPGPGVWTQVFTGQQRLAGARASEAGASRDLYLEIGCGRGDFLLQLASQHPENDYIGIEGQASVVLRAMEKAAAAGDGTALGEDAGEEDATSGEEATAAEDAGAGGLPNLRFVCAFVNSMEDLFAPGSLSGIYLNFSDPWPKSRHAKRRLTYRGRLRDYARTLKPGGFIAVKTDNDALFDFTLEEIEACGWTPEEMSRDLHESDLPARLVTTEYEKKFRAAGKNINYVKVVL